MKTLNTILLVAVFILGTSQVTTYLKLRQIEKGLPGQTLVADSTGTLTYSYGNNGIYSGSDTIPVATLATVTEDPDGNTMDFAIGNFPSWPDFNLDGTESGIYFGREYYGGAGITYGGTSTYSDLYLSENSTLYKVSNANQVDKSLLAMSQSSIEVSTSTATAGTKTEWKTDYQILTQTTGGNNYNIQFHLGTGSPNGVTVGDPGDIFINTSGGAGTTFYIKESGISTNTGWVGK